VGERVKCGLVQRTGYSWRTTLSSEVLMVRSLVHHLRKRLVIMDPLEIQTRAIIAAALIGAGAVEIPSIPNGGHRAPDAAGMRLRELTDYVYRLLTSEAPQEPE